MAWADFKELEKKFPGVQGAFQKLKERERLQPEDISPLQKFINSTVTVTTNVLELKRMFKGEEDWAREEILEGEDEVDEDCVDDCNGDSTKCNACAWKNAIIVRDRVLQVQWHHHTKSCKKHGTLCRFSFPRYPSEFTIIATTIPDEMKKVETETMAGLNFLRKKIETELQKVEHDYNERRKTDATAQIEENINSWLEKIIPNVYMGKDKSYITVKEGMTEFKFRSSIVRDSWKQNPKYDTLPLNHLTPIEILRSAIYHFILSVALCGTKVVLKRAMNEICINNYNHIWMLAWDGNMDIQPCLDYFSVVTYMTDYVAKAEKQTAEILKAVKQTKEREKVRVKLLRNYPYYYPVIYLGIIKRHDVCLSSSLPHW